jgi:hypothetical protein
MGKKTPAAPATPDYAGAAVAQGAANLESARATAKLSNPNTYTPYGTQLVSYEGDIPTIRQTLTPTAQKTLEAQQAVELSLANLGQQGARTASSVLDKPFSFGGPAVQTSLGPTEALQSGPSAGKYGFAGAVNPNAYGQASGMNADQYGLAQGGVAGPNLATSLDLSGIARMPVNAGMTGQEAIMSRLTPYLQQQRTSTEAQLVNQGLRPGTEAYNNAAKLLGQQENDARQQAALQGLNLDLTANQQGYGQALSSGQFGNQAQLAGFGANLQNQQAANQAIAQNYGQGMNAQQMQNAAIAQNFGQGTSAQAMQNQAIGQNYGQGMSAAQAENARIAQQFNQNQQAAQFGNTAQQQALAEAIQQRQLPLNEITALMSGSQIQNPQFGAYQGATVQPAPVFQATQAQGMFDANTYNQQVSQANANTAGMYSLGGAALGAPKGTFSDRRLKSNIVRIGTHPIGIGIYEYDIFGGRQIGVMAQELMDVMPDAVHQHPSGYLMVDYGRL